MWTEYDMKGEIEKFINNLDWDITEIIELCYNMMKGTIPREVIGGYLKNDFAYEVNRIVYELDMNEENED